MDCSITTSVIFLKLSFKDNLITYNKNKLGHVIILFQPRKIPIKEE
jgi:hypothetical protein